jgi:hypothetical protein
MTDSAPSSSPITYCANHPETETTLRCNRCEKPICPKCAVLTPTGYKCRECVRGQQKVFNTAQWFDFPLAFLVASGLSFLGSLIAPRLYFITIFVAPIAGSIIAEIVRAVLQRRRSLQLYRWTAIGAAVGSSPLLLLGLLGLLLGGSGNFLPLIWQGLYTFLVTSTVYYRLAGIQIR